MARVDVERSDEGADVTIGYAAPLHLWRKGNIENTPESDSKSRALFGEHERRISRSAAMQSSIVSFLVSLLSDIEVRRLRDHLKIPKSCFSK